VRSGGNKETVLLELLERGDYSDGEGAVAAVPRSQGNSKNYIRSRKLDKKVKSKNIIGKIRSSNADNQVKLFRNSDGQANRGKYPDKVRSRNNSDNIRSRPIDNQVTSNNSENRSRSRTNNKKNMSNGVDLIRSRNNHDQVISRNSDNQVRSRNNEQFRSRNGNTNDQIISRKSYQGRSRSINIKDRSNKRKDHGKLRNDEDQIISNNFIDPVRSRQILTTIKPTAIHKEDKHAGPAQPRGRVETTKVRTRNGQDQQFPSRGRKAQAKKIMSQSEIRQKGTFVNETSKKVESTTIHRQDSFEHRFLKSQKRKEINGNILGNTQIRSNLNNQRNPEPRERKINIRGRDRTQLPRKILKAVVDSNNIDKLDLQKPPLLDFKLNIPMVTEKYYDNEVNKGLLTIKPHSPKSRDPLLRIIKATTPKTPENSFFLPTVRPRNKKKSRGSTKNKTKTIEIEIQREELKSAFYNNKEEESGSSDRSRDQTRNSFDIKQINKLNYNKNEGSVNAVKGRTRNTIKKEEQQHTEEFLDEFNVGAENNEEKQNDEIKQKETYQNKQDASPLTNEEKYKAQTEIKIPLKTDRSIITESSNKQPDVKNIHQENSKNKSQETFLTTAPILIEDDDKFNLKK